VPFIFNLVILARDVFSALVFAGMLNTCITYNSVFSVHCQQHMYIVAALSANRSTAVQDMVVDCSLSIDAQIALHCVQLTNDRLADRFIEVGKHNSSFVL